MRIRLNNDDGIAVAYGSAHAVNPVSIGFGGFVSPCGIGAAIAVGNPVNGDNRRFACGVGTGHQTGKRAVFIPPRAVKPNGSRCGGNLVIQLFQLGIGFFLGGIVGIGFRPQVKRFGISMGFALEKRIRSRQAEIGTGFGIRFHLNP